MRRFSSKLINLCFVLNLVLIAGLQIETTMAAGQELSLSEFCDPKKANNFMDENLVISTYWQLINAFDCDHLKDLITGSLTLLKTQISEVSRSKIKRQNVLVYHKRRICKIVEALENTLGHKGNPDEEKYM